MGQAIRRNAVQIEIEGFFAHFGKEFGPMYGDKAVLVRVVFMVASVGFAEMRETDF
jgi:hypothetical protein